MIFLIVANSFTVTQAQQTRGVISIKIIDNENLPIEFAAAVLYKVRDSTITKIVMTDNKGSAIFEDVLYEKYYIQSTFVGFTEKYTNPFVLDSQLKELLPIRMEPDLVLDEVVVRGKKKLIERKIDRIVFNVDATLASDGGNLSEVLKILPGVIVGNNGSLTLKGKSGVVVLIDGRRSYLKGADLENYINSMPASQFSNIEIMTNPPAKYDAEGNAGIINIITKRNGQKGWNLDFASSYRQGRFSEINNNLSWNFNGTKVNLFGNVSYTDKNNFDDYIINRNFRDSGGDIESIFLQNTFIKKENQYITGRLGLDFFPNSNSTLGFLVSAQGTNGAAITNNNTFLKDETNNLLTTLIAPAKSKSDYDNIQVNLHFTHTIDSAGTEVTIDLDYLKYDSRINQLFENRFFDNQGEQLSEEILDNTLPQIINIYNAKIDYTQSISENIKLEVGVKTSFVDTDNDAKYFENINGELIENTELSNHFKYDENVNAGYLNYVQKINNWSVQAGLRIEQTSIEGNQVTLNTIFKNNYTKALPSLFLTYQLNEETQVGFSYGKRLQRPDYRDLNPFRYFYDRFTFEEGNPNLNPQFSDNLELSYSIWEGALTTTAYYNNTKDIITDVIFQNVEFNETFIRKDNLNNLKTYGISLNAEVPITNKWSASFNFDYSINDLNGKVDNEEFTINTNTFSGFMLHQYKFAKAWTFEMAAWYTSESLSDTFIQKPYGRFALAIGKSLWNGQGKIRLSGNDIFKWTNFKGRSGFPNTDVQVDNWWQTQTIKLAFTYKMGSGYVKKRKERKSGIEEESERLNPYNEK